MSEYLKIKLALDNDAEWGLRLDIAFELNGIEDTRQNRIRVTSHPDVIKDIVIEELSGAINTSSVTDSAIDVALNSLDSNEVE